MVLIRNGGEKFVRQGTLVRKTSILNATYGGGQYGHEIVPAWVVLLSGEEVVVPESIMTVAK